MKRSLNGANRSENAETSNVIEGKQKKWKTFFAVFFTILAWTYILVYIIFILYGVIAKAYNLYIPKFFIYDASVVVKTQGIFKSLFIFALIEFIVLFVWMKYNYVRFAPKNRRKFTPPVTNEELDNYFELEPGTATKLQNEKIIVLEKNIIKDHFN